MSTLQKKLDEIKQAVAALEYDIGRLDAGVMCASTAARLKLLSIAKTCSQMRKDCSEAKKSIKASRSDKKSKAASDNLPPKKLKLVREKTAAVVKA